MTYTPEWYRDYFIELQREPIRKIHDDVFKVYKSLHRDLFLRPLETVDLGSATCEFGLYAGGVMNYAGLDLNRMPAIPEIDHLRRFICDFTQPWPMLGFMPNSFVSLFASELILSFEEREKLYRRILRDYPTIKTGLVAGLYYQGHEDKEVYSEPIYSEGKPTGEHFAVRQTIQRPLNHPGIMELRIETYPSYRMFGTNCVEVWRIFVRR